MMHQHLSVSVGELEAFLKAYVHNASSDHAMRMCAVDATTVRQIAELGPDVDPERRVFIQGMQLENAMHFRGALLLLLYDPMEDEHYQLTISAMLVRQVPIGEASLPDDHLEF